MTPNWITLSIEGDTGPAGPGVRALLSGVAYRSQYGAGATLGHVVADDRGLMLRTNAGTEQVLTPALARTLEFDVPEHRLQQLSGTGPRTEDDIVRIVAGCPEWARRTVARHLAPERYAAWENGAKEKRKQQLREIGAKVSGKKAQTDAGKPAAKATDPRAARRAQLQAIGKAVSR